MLLSQSLSKPKSKISLTPLIDVVFILLLFFMLSSSFMQWRQINISAPSESQSDAVEMITVTVLNDAGELEIANEQFLLTNREQMHAMIMRDVNALYVIRISPGVTTQTMISVLDAIKLAGGKNVSLAGIVK